MKRILIQFEADISLDEDEVREAGSLEQAVQNAIGHTGAAVYDGAMKMGETEGA